VYGRPTEPASNALAAAAGEDGYLADKGLIPLPEEEREAQRAQALAFTPLTM